MFADFDLSKLPSLPLSQRGSLPNYSAIYFVVDSKNRVLYVGQATNLLARWKDHHRQEQLSRINRKNPIKISWLSCSNELKILINTENHFINLYQPLLNRTPVPAKKITPTEIVLQQTLRKLVNLNVVVFGFESATDSLLPTVYLKYPINLYVNESDGIKFINNTGAVNNIVRASNNRKIARLKWREYERKKFRQSKVRSWKTACNGVSIELSPWRVGQGTYLNWQPKLQENTTIQTVAGIEMPTLNELELQKILNKYPFVEESYPKISVLEHDPIRLFWSRE